MKKTILSGTIIVVLGLLIAFGPQVMFKVCPPTATEASVEASAEGCGATGGGCGCSGGSAMNVSYPACHWAARAEIGIGMFIAALGICLFIFNDPKTQLGLFIGIFMAGIIAIGIPLALIGGCKATTMACRSLAFPAITILSILLLVYSASIAVYSGCKNKSAL